MNLSFKSAPIDPFSHLRRTNIRSDRLVSVSAIARLPALRPTEEIAHFKTRQVKYIERRLSFAKRGTTMLCIDVSCKSKSENL